MKENLDQIVKATCKAIEDGDKDTLREIIRLGQFLDLLEKGIVSNNFFYNRFNYEPNQNIEWNYDVETEKIRREQQYRRTIGIGPAIITKQALDCIEKGAEGERNDKNCNE